MPDSSLAIIQADARRIPLADGVVQCVVTSPPYWGLRKYAGAQDVLWEKYAGFDCPDHEWTEQERGISGGQNQGSKSDNADGATNIAVPPSLHSTCLRCGAWRGGYGLEPTIEMYVAHTVEILREIRRVLRADGVVFWNVGDSYAGSWGAQGRTNGGSTYNNSQISSGQIDHMPRKTTNTRSIRDAGLKPKDLCLIPERVAIAAQADGWWVRSMIIWAKPNPMPESCTDRPTDAYEHILMLTKSARYFWDPDAVREPAVAGELRATFRGGGVYTNNQSFDNSRSVKCDDAGMDKPTVTDRNLRNVWTFPTQPYKGAHFATFPEEIPRRCILAATSERGACAQCGAPWQRIVKASGGSIGKGFHDHSADAEKGQRMGATAPSTKDGTYHRETTGWKPTCKCFPGLDTRPCLVLDPFGGSGTTGRVAVELNRRAVSLDLAYHDHAERRTRGVQRRLVTA